MGNMRKWCEALSSKITPWSALPGSFGRFTASPEILQKSGHLLIEQRCDLKNRGSTLGIIFFLLRNDVVKWKNGAILERPVGHCVSSC